jgi:polyisoprenoid-binding protein YceI
MKGIRRTLVLLTSLNAFAVAQAADTYDIDPVHTQILFFVSHLGYSNSEGEFNKAAEFPMSKKFKTGFSATTTIKRSEWGMTFGLPMGIGDEVEIRLEVEGFRE